MKTFLVRLLAIISTAFITAVVSYFILVRPVINGWLTFHWYSLFLPVVIVALIFTGYKLLMWSLRQFDTDGDGVVEFEELDDMIDDILDSLGLDTLIKWKENMEERIAKQEEESK